MEGFPLSINLEPLWKQVADGIRRAIQTGALKPGDRVVESHIATQLGISRGPIREGIRQLQERGILEYRTNAGTVVASVSRADALQAIKTRVFLEASAIELLLESSEAGWQNALNDVVARMRECGEDEPLEQVEALDEEFHAALIDATGSVFLKRQWETADPYTWVVIARHEYGAGETQRPARLIDYHQPLLEALSSRDVGAAIEMMREHILVSAGCFQELAAHRDSVLPE